MRWPPQRLLAALCAELGLPAPAEGEDQPVEQRLGRGHERAMGAGRRGRGAYYTPPPVVAHVVEHTLGAWLEGRAGSLCHVLDPACGAGAFLASAYRRLLDAASTTRGRPLTLAERRRLLREQIHGVELDADAARICRVALALVAMEQDEPAQVDAAALEDLSGDIRRGDALDDLALPDEEHSGWRDAYPAVFERPEGGFDVVLGNPPYLGGVQRRTRLPAPLLKRLRSRYAAARGAVDASVLFQELALRLLAPGGRAGLLVSNKFLASAFGVAFRELAAARAELRLLADLSEARLFPGASVYPVVCVMERRVPRASYPVELQCFAPGTELRLRSRREAAHGAGDADWTPLLSEQAELLRRLQALHPPLATRYEVRAAATPEEAYRLKAALREGTSEEPAFLFLTSGAILRYGHRHGAPQRYLGLRLTAPYLPRASPLLSETRRHQYGTEKLVIASMTRRLRVLWDPGGIAPSVPALQVMPREGAVELRSLLALLNSRLLSWLLRQRFSPLALSGGYLRIGREQIGALPVAELKEEERRRLVEAAALMESAGGEEREAVDRDLDRLVYALYGLDEAEVAAVERDRIA